ncbi:heptaprenyl diphosphate synthase component II [Marinicrinis lubricantis]|uniref:Heptaprenyl diphosphate synthase component II n=1 Tax=Marinicrinis lubricantis TaxID=2086470 RepID=A0ABW1IM16_9BACL
MKLIDIYARLKSDIQIIEKELEKSITSEHRLLHDASLHLLKAGGKRLRPVFVLLAGEFGHYDIDQLKYVAVPLELIHMASLVHDDVIDNADTRRGKLTVKSKWDNRIAMYTGDYIFAKALHMATELKNPLIHQILSKAMVQMSIGEMEQIRFFYNTEQRIYDYLLRIRRKTALLIAVSCQLGAIASGLGHAEMRMLYAYGYNVGMAFQIRDDVLDICGTEKELGKPPGSDIRQGNITLPVIYALQNESARSSLLDEIQKISENAKRQDIRTFIDILKETDGLQKAEELSSRYIDKAIAALDDLPKSKTKKNLIDIAYFVGNRSH